MPSLPPPLRSLLQQRLYPAARAAGASGGAALLPAGRRAGPLAGPPRARLGELWHGIEQEAQQKNIAWHEWGCFATATLLTLNASAPLADFHRHSVPAALPLAERLVRAQLMRETGLKCIGFIGIPKVINNLAALRAAVDEDAELAEALPTAPRRKVTSDSLPRVQAAAEALWDDIYTPHSAKLVKILGKSHPDLPVFIIDGEYGPLFSPPASFAAAPEQEPAWEVGRLRTSLVAVAALRAQGGVGPQVTSHIWGLLKAAPAAHGAGQQWLCTEEGALWVVRTVDKICQAVEQVPEDDGPAARESKL